jgi:hypothetical protein
MKNWKLVIEAYGLDILEADRERILLPLQGLETDFRKIASAIPADIDSCLIFDAGTEPK